MCLHRNSSVIINNICLRRLWYHITILLLLLLSLILIKYKNISEERGVSSSIKFKLELLESTVFCISFLPLLFITFSLQLKHSTLSPSFVDLEKCFSQDPENPLPFNYLKSRSLCALFQLTSVSSILMSHNLYRAIFSK